MARRADDGGDASAFRIGCAEAGPNLLSLVERWLERTPFLEIGTFKWWTHYQVRSRCWRVRAALAPPSRRRAPSSPPAPAPSHPSQHAVNAMFDADERSISINTMLSEEARATQQQELRNQRSTFDSLFNEAAYEELRKRGDRRMSYRAMQAVRRRAMFSRRRSTTCVLM